MHDSFTSIVVPQRLIILDRDGVINEDSDAYIKSLAEWRPYPQAIDAMARLSKAGWTVAVATNQSGIGRGLYKESVFLHMNERLHALVEEKGGEIAHIAYCPHTPDDACDCRKPKVGLLVEIQDKLGLDTLDGAWMVGDSLRDLQAGHAMRCHCVLVRSGKGCRTEAEGALERLPDAFVFDDLGDFADHLLGFV